MDEAASHPTDAAARTIAAWVQTFLMRPHPDLGRTGHVCPFTSQATRLGLVRIGASPLNGDDPAAIHRVMRAALGAFEALPCPRAQRIFRTVVVAFPNCADAAGIGALRAAQNAMRHHSVLRGKMIGLFEPGSSAEGLINRDFRPLRAPVPALAIRMLVKQDAPFVVRNPLLLPIYLAKFPLKGAARLARIVVAVKPKPAPAASRG